VTEETESGGGVRAYRDVLAIPAVAWSVLPIFVALLPMAGMAVTLTLHVVTALDRGYVAAGLVGTATTVGTMLGAPLVGRALDRHGLRPVVAVCGAVSAAYWLATPWLPYEALLVAAFPAGALMVPVNSIARQVVAASVPADKLRAAFSLETILIELSFILGPALTVLIAAEVSTKAALTAIGVVVAIVAAVLYHRNPPIRGEAGEAGDAGETEPAGPARPRGLLNRNLVATLFISVSALFVLGGIELAVVATLRAGGQVGWTGVVMAIGATASIAGGIVYGAAKRGVPQLLLVALLAVLVLPGALVGQPWWLLALVLVPNQLVCTPTFAATTENVIRHAPPHARGAATGLYDSATRLGIAVSAPVVGFVIDHSSPAWGFVTAGLGGLLLAGVGAVLTRPVPAREEAPEQGREANLATS
jgi:predicted MFS family arabinose efflux permease